MKEEERREMTGGEEVGGVARGSSIDKEFKKQFAD